jgi:hypothetical protein
VFTEPNNSALIPIISDVVTTPITTLVDGDTREFAVEAVVTDAVWDRLRWVVVAGYQPSGANRPFDTLQAVAGP